MAMVAALFNQIIYGVNIIKFMCNCIFKQRPAVHQKKKKLRNAHESHYTEASFQQYLMIFESKQNLLHNSQRDINCALLHHADANVVGNYDLH